MEQRPLRLGDIVDDYCPRERRITNHAIVAIVETAIRQTRCTTCEAEHEFKGARVPRRRKADDKLYEQVLSEVSSERGRGADDARPSESVAVEEPVPAAEDAAESGETLAASSGDESAVVDEASAEAAHEASLHRRLIRATLPRTDGEAPSRPIPEFTMHQRQTRGSREFRAMLGGHSPNGRPERDGNRADRPDRSDGGGNANRAAGQGENRGRRHGKGRSGRRRGRGKRPQ